ncbi:MAG: DUF1788 domain-containing protein, partial [Chloroflexi bacterium]|nr:DUF1788 domain-containing protein [Chloroflexota bacterium]
HHSRPPAARPGGLCFCICRHIAFIVRAGGLAPNIYRVSKLLDEMKGRTRVPCVLFMPATTEGRTSLRFMGIAENEGRGSYHTKVYAD